MYYNFTEPVKKAAGHRILALNRGEGEDPYCENHCSGREDSALSGEEGNHQENPETARVLREVTEDSYKRLISCH